ncbi:hypothetical protein F2Q68_00039723 [Brassica cretica]|uniref:Uncharacterized protein n=1 Tax=Brassica cretica TaxID=69181 RepID=A0A8S9MMZ7_BRACR|nr:hypothetical protein F2Q68_00039723 [Brassica cretica]
MGEWSSEECVEKGVLVICVGVSGYVKAGSIEGFLSMEVGEAEVSVGCNTDNFAGVSGYVKAGSIDGFLSMEVGEAEVSVGCDTDNFAGVSGYVKAGSIEGFLSMEVGEAEVSVGCNTDNFAGVADFEEVCPEFELAAFAYDKGGNSARAEKVLVVWVRCLS